MLLSEPHVSLYRRKRMALTQKALTPPHLDEVDAKILKLLSQDAKMAFADLAAKINLTAPAIHARVKKLEKMGVIKNYGIELNYEAIGLPVTAFIRVQTSSKLSCRQAGAKLLAFPEIEECHAVAGEDDLMLKTRTATPLQLQNLLDRMKTEGLVEKSISVFVLETHFERPRVP
jgi:Lrp/AsnC family transcriptional regulator, leucine-responsive regulatory protein